MKAMVNPSRIHDAQNPSPIEEFDVPPVVVVVVECIVNIAGCFGSNDHHHHHTTTARHIDAMVEWAVGQGMYPKDARSLADRKPQKMDEAIYYLLHMDERRRDDLRNIGGWIVWYINTQASGQRPHRSDAGPVTRDDQGNKKVRY